MITQYKLLTSMIEVYETHLELNEDFWGSDLEVTLNTQVNNLLLNFGIKTEQELEDALFKATLEEMVAYWKEWIEKVKWDLNEVHVGSVYM